MLTLDPSVMAMVISFFRVKKNREPPEVFAAIENNRKGFKRANILMCG